MTYPYHPYRQRPFDPFTTFPFHHQPYQQPPHNFVQQPPNFPMYSMKQPPFQPFTPPGAQSPFHSILSNFKTENGNLDLNKMMSTVGQISNTVNQVSPLLKQMGSFFSTPK